MADIQAVDEVSANRFISSLSKSLQALCHGCMDFDAGIEIVGYININIDSGNKVDCVLNEKVLKSNDTNSMSFVSNSFLAKKIESKITKDGSCSPVPELNYSQGRNQGNYSHGTQLYRSNIYTPNSQVVRGSQKRPWPSGDWRGTPRKFLRGSKSSYGSSYAQPQTSAQSDYSSYSNQASTSSPSAASQQAHEYLSSIPSQQSDVNIKTEVDDNVADNSSNADLTNQTNDKSNSFNIKADPDATPEDRNEVATTKQEAVDSFSQSADDNSNENQGASNYDQSQVDSEVYDQEQTNESQEQSDVNPNYEGYDDSYSREGTSGQFEVIEIDDEDEDVAAMFNENPQFVTDISSNSLHPSTREYGSRKYCCRICNLKFGIAQQYAKHVNDNHSDSNILPFKCDECGKGFLSHNGLHSHLPSHQENTFKCNICVQKFVHASSLRRHLLTCHNLKRCRYCSYLFQMGHEFDHHVMHCGRETFKVT